MRRVVRLPPRGEPPVASHFRVVDVNSVVIDWAVLCPSRSTMHVVITTVRHVLTTIAGKGDSCGLLHTGNKNASLSWNNDLSKTALCMLFYYHSYCTHENGSNLVGTEIERGMDLLTG